jgi:hypothetical protein
MVPIGLMRGSLKTACLIYMSSSMLSFFIVPLNIALLYTLFFGMYGLIKYFIERYRNLPLEIVLKLVFCNIMFFVVFIFMQRFLGYNVLNKLSNIFSAHLPLNSQKISLLLIGFVIQFAFIIFDYALTLLIDYYQRLASKL